MNGNKSHLSIFALSKTEEGGREKGDADVVLHIFQRKV